MVDCLPDGRIVEDAGAKYLRALAAQPAFPQGKFDQVGHVATSKMSGGLTKREWFAGQALVAIMASLPLPPRKVPDPDEIAGGAVELADALIEALNK